MSDQSIQHPLAPTPPPSEPAASAPPVVTPAKINTFSIVALVLAWFFGIGGVVFGHIALHQIKQTGEAGRGFAIAALIVGYTLIASSALLVLLYFSLIGLYLTGVPFSGVNA